jgi:hypothetical protein
MATINRIVQAVRSSGRAFFAKVRNLVPIAIDSDSGANANPAKESTVVKSAKRPWPLTPSAKAAVFALSVLSAVAAHSQANIVTLTVAPVPAHAGDVITLQAVVYNAAGNPCGNCGNVEFLDASVQPHLIGTAMLSNSGVGSVLVRFGAGSHSITAFHPTTVYANSSNNVAGNQTSPATVLVVSPPATSYPTSTTISQSGAAGNYTLSAMTLGSGLGAPTGTISFQDVSNSNSVLGTGTFSSRTGYFPAGTVSGAVSANPNAMVAADFNNDGYPDLAIINTSNNTISVYLNNGNGTFGSALTFSVPNNGAVALAAGDPYASGNLGLLVGTGSEILFFSGYGNGTFSLASTHNLNHTPSQVLFGCYPELWDQVMCSVSQSSAILEEYFFNPLTSTMSPFGNALNGVSGDMDALGGISSNLVTANFNGDGNQYFAYGNVSSKVAVVYTTFVTQATSSANYPVGAPPIAMVAGDFNNDGYPDIAVVTQNNGLWILLSNGASGTFGTPYGVVALPYPGAIVTADFNGDGNLDLGIQQPGAHPILIFYGNGAGGFSAAPEPSVTTGFANNNGTIAVGDFNGDGLADLVATPNTGNTNAFSIMLGQQAETATKAGLIAYGNGVQNADAVYTPGSNDSWATSTSSTTAVQGVYTPAAGATPATGSDTLSVAFTPTDTTDYNNATATTTLIVTTNISPITPTIVWPTPASMTSGAALTSAQLNATAVAGGAPVEGTFVYTPAAGTTPAIGLDTLTVTFTPANSVEYTPTTASVVLTVGDFFKMGCGSSEGCATSLGCGSSAGQTLRPGGSLTYTLAVMPTALSALPGPLTFNATGLPPDTTVTFSPSQVPAGSGATNVTITIQDNSPQAANTRSQERWPITLAMLLPVLGILSLRQRVGKLPQLRVRAALGTLCLGAILGLTGCGGFAINSPKCYTVVVTAQCGALQHKAETMIKVEN